MKCKTIILLCTLALLLAACGAGGAEGPEAMLDRGAYAEAEARLEGMGSSGDAPRLLMYARAAQAVEAGAYDRARDAFQVLGDFRDSEQMVLYCAAREAQEAGLAALDAGDGPEVLLDAEGRYEELGAFRDAPERAAACRQAVYDRGLNLLESGQYAGAQHLFTALGESGLAQYCSACLLEADGELLAAAAAFSEISSVRDASARAEAARDSIYREAGTLADAGESESAAALFSALGSFRDAPERLDSMVREIVRTRLRSRDYEGALFLWDAAPEALPPEAASAADRERIEPFLDSFLQAYLHFSAGSMDSWSGYYGVYPFVEAGGALDRRFVQVTMIGSYSHNSNFQYYGSELLDLLRWEEGCYLAYVRTMASVIQPIGPVEVTRTFRVLVRDTGTSLVVGALDDVLYGDESNPSGRPVISGPLPGGALPEDADGDGIILVDVWKKGFKGTMIIVLDPARVFAGFPGFYGGNGMLLEDLSQRYDALGGINGGGFIDEDGGGSGGLPEGLTIVEGEVYHWVDSGASAAFDENNVLHVGYYTAELAEKDHIRDCVSFGPALIVNGSPEYGSYMESGINPRTAIGQRKDGAVLMLCIDGRQLRSIGASFADLRDVMLDFGAVNACSLDGGSSTVMYYDGAYLNMPSSASGTSRYLPNAFLIRR